MHGLGPRRRRARLVPRTRRAAARGASRAARCRAISSSARWIADGSGTVRAQGAGPRDGYAAKCRSTPPVQVRRYGRVPGAGGPDTRANRSAAKTLKRAEQTAILRHFPGGPPLAPSGARPLASGDQSWQSSDLSRSCGAFHGAIVSPYSSPPWPWPAPASAPGPSSARPTCRSSPQHHAPVHVKTFQDDLNNLVMSGRKAEAFILAFERGDEHLRRLVQRPGWQRRQRGQRRALQPRAARRSEPVPASGARTFRRGPPAPTPPPASSATTSRSRTGPVCPRATCTAIPRRSASLGKFIQRNAPHLFGSGAVQRLAEEMTDELRARAARRHRRLRDAGLHRHRHPDHQGDQLRHGHHHPHRARPRADSPEQLHGHRRHPVHRSGRLPGGRRPPTSRACRASVVTWWCAGSSGRGPSPSSATSTGTPRNQEIGMQSVEMAGERSGRRLRRRDQRAARRRPDRPGGLHPGPAAPDHPPGAGPPGPDPGADPGGERRHRAGHHPVQRHRLRHLPHAQPDHQPGDVQRAQPERRASGTRASRPVRIPLSRGLEPGHRRQLRPDQRPARQPHRGQRRARCASAPSRRAPRRAAPSCGCSAI